jgi:hypothetical protein
MMKIKALQITIVVLVISLFGGMAYGQTWPAGLQKHGNNSSGNPSAGETIDSVTIGATMDYFVMPDPNVNPGYDYLTNPLTNLLSTFNWAATTGSTSITPHTSGVTPIPNYVAILWSNTTGNYNVVVTETSSAGCAAAAPTSIPVTLINKPTAQFTSTSASVCSSNPATVSYNFPFTLTTDVADGFIRVHLNIVNTTTSTTLFNSDVDLNKISATSYTFSAFDNYGVITATITQVNDRISRKSNVLGLIGANNVFTFTINRIPVTGNIYHVPNK